MVDGPPDSGIDDDATLGSSVTGGVGDVTEGRRAAKLGDTIGRYVLLRPIASGGMGQVWAAWDPELDRNVAVKLLLPRKSGREEREALVREARALARLSHPHVVQVYDVGTWGDEVWVALEYLGGTPLDRWVKASPRSWSEVLAVVLDAGRGLAAAHVAGLVHLDVKPGNVVVGDDDVVRVLDFGLARRVASDSSPTDTGARSVGETAERMPRPAVGTIGYIAPELLLGGEPEERCDQFGFCVMAWEALVGVRPFSGRRRAEYERAVVSGAIGEPPPGTRVPARVLRVLRRGLAPRPEHRFPDMHTLLFALERARVSWTSRLAVPVGFGIAAVAGFVVLRPPSVEPPACDGGHAELAAVWTPERRAAVASAFAATREPYADSAWTTVDASLAGWGERWAAALDATCTSAAVRHEISEEVEQRKNACLRDQLLAVDAMASVFVAADHDVVERAAAAVRALPDPDACDDLDRLGHVDSSPREQGAARRLALARALLQAHRVGQAVEVVRALASDAEASEAHGTAAAAHFVWGSAETRRGAIEDAVGHFHRAVWAAELAGDDELRAESFTELVYTTGHLGHDFVRAHWYARQAAEIMTRIGATSGPRSMLEANVGTVLADEGRYGESVARYRDAIAMRLAAGFGADDVFATLMNNLGGAYQAQADYGAAAAWFTQAYALRVVLSGPDHPDVADVLVNQGNVLQLLGQDDAALADYTRAIEIVERTRGVDEPSLRIVHNDIAVVLAKLGRNDEALAHYRESLRLWRVLDEQHPMIGVVKHNIAEIQTTLGRYDDALVLEHEALDVLRRAYPAGHPYLVAVLSGIGRSELASGDADAAIAPLRAALDMAAHVEADPQLEGEANFALGQALDRVGRDRVLVAGHVRRARALLVEIGARGKPLLDELDAWTAARGI